MIEHMDNINISVLYLNILIYVLKDSYLDHEIVSILKNWKLENFKNFR